MWFVNWGYGWDAKTAWTTNNTFVWTPGDTNPYYRIGVWVKSATNTANTFEASAEMNYPTGERVLTMTSTTTTTSSTVTAVALVPDTTGTGVGVPVTFTATPTGGVAPQQYKWFVFNGTWTAVTNTCGRQPARTPTTAWVYGCAAQRQRLISCRLRRSTATPSSKHDL
jgi:hypothetical protein